MGRIFKKVLIGSGLAIVIFLAVIFLFGDAYHIQLSFESFGQTINRLPALISQPSKNLTRGFSDQLATGILHNNPNGPVAVGGTLAIDLNNPTALVSQALAKEIHNFSASDLDPVIDPTKFNTVKTTRASAAWGIQIPPGACHRDFPGAPRG